MDKSKESLFFQEQTGITEDNFFATCISEQENVKLSSNDKNQVIQKLSNLVSTGDENTSYKKVVDRLNKMQLEKVGSARSNGRPINIAEEEIDRLEAERKEISQFEEQKYQVEEAKQTLKTDLEDNRIVLDLLRRQKVNLEKSEIEEEKLKIFKKNLAQNKDEQDLLEEKLNDLVEERKGNLKKGKVGYYVGILLAIVISVIAFFIKKYLLFVGNIVPIFFICIQFALNKQKTRRIKKNGRRIQQERIELEERLKNLEKNYEKQEKEIEERKNEILAVQKEREKDIAKDFTNKLDEEIITDILSTDYSKIVEFIDEKEREQTDFAINEKKIDLDNENIGSKLEELVEIDEKLENLYETKDNLLQLNNMYEMAKEEIENAYQAMKENITPEFIEELKQILSDVTEGKYTECYIDSENNILVETENGKYIPIELLSVGTIDLIYLALRISAAKEISKEKMPIILDESFAYYDNDRMARILRYLETLDRQVIIFTCSSREKDILEKEGIKFNLISMNHA
jgi:DNA repair exonuclease SbcCD ATPase subunit